MSVVIINALDVPEGSGPEVEARFAGRRHAVDGAPGFEGFQLLRPLAGQQRYFVVTTWATRADFEVWREGTRAAHAQGGGTAGPDREPVVTGSEVWEFEVADLP